MDFLLLIRSSNCDVTKLQPVCSMAFRIKGESQITASFYRLRRIQGEDENRKRIVDEISNRWHINFVQNLTFTGRLGFLLFVILESYFNFCVTALLPMCAYTLYSYPRVELVVYILVANRTGRRKSVAKEITLHMETLRKA